MFLKGISRFLGLYLQVFERYFEFLRGLLSFGGAFEGIYNIPIYICPGEALPPGVLANTYYILYTMYCILYDMYYKLYTMYYILHTTYYILYHSTVQ